MTDTKKLIEFLREIAVYLKMMRRAGWITKEIEEDGKAKLKQIRGTLKQQEFMIRKPIVLKHPAGDAMLEQPKPDNDELVRRLDEFERNSKAGMTILDIHIFEEIRFKLLQQTKPVVTRGEIDELCETLETIINPEDPTDMDRYMKQYIKDWLKSKGFEEEEKP